MNSKKQLAVALSRLQSFEKPSLKLEQYATDSEIAAEIIWTANQNNDLYNKVIADLGCGTGILGIGTMFFHPKKIFFIDKDERTLKKLESNLKLFEFKNYEIICTDVTKFNKKVDVVFQNPPFGTKDKHADKIFLEKAFSIADVVYSFHKLSTKKFVEAISQDNGFEITHFFSYDFPLKQTQFYHTRKLHKINVGCWRLKKK